MQIVYEKICHISEQGCEAGMGAGGCNSSICAFYNKEEANKYLKYLKKNNYIRTYMNVYELNSKKVYIIIYGMCYKDLPWNATDITLFNSYEEANKHSLYIKQNKQHRGSHIVMRAGIDVYSSFKDAVKG